MEKIKCPCCGGETSNYLNCDYCGSYLVRFNKRNINYEDSLLGKGAKCLQGIQEELQANIDEQINTGSQNHICSQTSFGKLTIDIKNPRAISDFVEYSLKVVNFLGHKNLYIFPDNPYDDNDISLILVVRVLEFSESKVKSSDYMEMKQLEENQKLEWLKRTGLFEICAKADDPILSIYGKVGVCHSFYINFGQDIVGASKAISSFLYGCSSMKDKKLSFKRTSDKEIVYQSKIRKLADDKKSRSKVLLFQSVLFYSFFVLWLVFQYREKYPVPIGIVNGIATFIFIIYVLYLLFGDSFRKDSNSISKNIDRYLS